MAEDANANIRIDIDTSEATAALKALQGQIARFHTEMARGGAAAGQVASKLQNNLINSINAGGQFQASMTKVESTTEAFTTALEKNKLSMGQYFRYAAASTKTFGKFFGKEFQTITKVATERVKDLQTQYISMGRDANGALQSIKVRPLTLDMKSLTTQTMLAAQKQQLYNQLLKQGSTNLLNFGKNTQWAGRQLMVGFTIPLTMFAAAASKSFMDIEKQIIKIRRVYGDFNTTVQQTDEMIKSIRTLASEYTKYGVAVKDTLGLASDAAAAGKTGQELLAQVSEATRLAVLGNVTQTQALETTMSVTNAFGVATQDLANKIDFLNAVENQSVTSIEDLTIAIPKAGPVVQQLGGDVEDLAFFLTAMKEGGINASEGANALKSGLAALINPTGKAKEMLQGFGINIEKIVNSNKGDVKGLVLDFSAALDTLDPLNRARAIEQLFGKFQFSRLSTLFQNVIGEGTQAARVLELTKATTQELAILSQRELKRVEDTTTYKFEKAFADFQNALAPVGEEFLKVVTPIIEFGTKLLQQFNSMGDGAKAFTVILTTVVAGIGPALLMTVGLVANGVANLIKMFSVIGNLFNKTGGDAANLGLSTEYMTQQQIEAAAVAASLGQSHSRLTQIFSVEAAALNSLTLAYQKAITAQQGFGIGGGKVPGSATKPKKYATGGVVRGPGTGTSDSIPAMLSNGEAVIPAKQAKKYSGFISQMISGNVPGFFGGVMLPQKLGKTIKARKEYEAPAEEANLGYLQSSLAGREPEQYLRQHSGSGGHSFEPFGVGGAYIKPDGTPVMVKPVQNEQLARAEIFGTRIAREAHGLQAPEQRLVVIQDPTDLTGQRRFLALESAYDQTFVAPEQQSFTKGQFFKQLVASLVRNDKDLQSANLWGNVIADVGPAGVFAKASGVRSLTADLPSMQQQAMINLLGVKGGARKDFALATADIARGLSPADYARGITREIDEVLPRLRSTINSFDLNPQEKIAYQAMIARLEAGRNTDWTQMQAVHAAAMPTAPKAQGFARGGFVGKKPPITTTDKKPTPGSRIPAEAYDFDDTLIDFGQYLTKSREANKKLPWKDRVKWWSDEELRGAINVAHPMPRVIEQLKKSQQAGKQIIVLTARPSSADGITREHLAALGIDPTNIKIVSRNRLDPEMAALKAPELKNKLASQLINDYDIEAFYDDLLENRKALSVLGIKTFDPLKMAKGGMVPGFSDGGIVGGRRATVAFGAHQPFTTAHQMIAQLGMERAAMSQSQFMQFTSTQGKSGRSILTDDLKRKLIAEALGIEPQFAKNPFDLMAALSAKGFKDVELLLGQDRMDSSVWDKAAKEAGINLTKVGIPRPEGSPSGTAARAAAAAGDKSTFLKLLASGVSKRTSGSVFSALFKALSGGKKTPGYANGVVSVPGPKGKGDVVPAMLSPGEAVIPTKMAKKYGGLINGMIAGNIPGYETGTPGKQVVSDFGYNQGHFSGLQKATGQQLMDMAENESQFAAIQARLQEEARLLSEIRGNVVTFDDILQETFQVYDNRVVSQSAKLNNMLGQGSSAPVSMVQEEYGAMRGQAHGFAAKSMELAGVPEEKIKATLVDLADEVDGGIQAFIDRTGQTADQVRISADQLDEIFNTAYTNVASRNEDLAETYEEMKKVSNLASVEKTSTGSINRKDTFGRTRPNYKGGQAVVDATYNAGLRYSESPDKPHLARISKRVWYGDNIPIAQEVRDRNPEAYRDLIQEPDVAKRLQMLHEEAKKLGIEIIDSGTKGMTEGFDTATQRNSPPKEAIKAGEDYGDALTTGARSKIDDAKATGEALGKATTDGTQAGARRATRPAGQTIDGVFYPVGFSPAPGISETPIGPMTEKEYKKQEFARKHPKISKAAGSIAGFARGPGGMMAASMAGMPLMMTPGLEGLGMAVSVVAPMLMMLPGAILGVAAALAGMVGIVMALNAAQEEQRRKAVELANAQTMSINSINQMAEDFGTVGATQLRQSEENAKASGVSQRRLSEGEQYLTNAPTGQALLASVKTQQEAGLSSSDIAENVASNIATAVAQNVITKKQGESIIAALGRLSGDTRIASTGIAQFNTLTENIEKTAGLVSAQDLQSLRAANAENVVIGAVGSDMEGNIIKRVVGGGSPELATQGMNAYGRAVAGIDSINAQYETSIKEAKTKKEILRLEQERSTELVNQKQRIEDIYNETVKQQQALGGAKFDDAFVADIEAQFGKESPMAQTARDIKNLPNTKFKLNLQMGFAGGNISAEQAQYLLTRAQNNEGFALNYELQVQYSVSREEQEKINKLREDAGKDPIDFSEDEDDKDKDPPKSDSGSSEDELSPLEKKIEKRNKALQIIGLKEAAINKKYEERKKALEEIARINSQIAQQQRDQLDIADALSRGDIAAAARAAQQFRINQTQRAQEAQAKALEDAQKKELEGVTFGGGTRKSLEALLAKLVMRFEKQEYRKLAGGGSVTKGYAGGGMIIPKRMAVGGKVKGYPMGGLIPYKAEGGFFKSLGSDTVPAMLTPGEFVVKRPAVKNFGVKNLESINNGSYGGNSVYNYSINVNAGTDASPEQIARAVSQNIKRTESYRLRGNKI